MTVEVLSLALGFLVFVAFESSREALKDRSEDEVLHGRWSETVFGAGSALDLRDKGIDDPRGG